MKESTLLLALAGVGIGVGVAYIVASGKTEEIKKQFSNISNVPQIVSQYVEKVKEVPQVASQYRETISKETQYIKETINNVGSTVSSSTNAITSGFTNFINQGVQKYNEVKETLTPKTEYLPKQEPSPLSVQGFQKTQDELTKDINYWMQRKPQTPVEYFAKYVALPGAVFTRDVTLNVAKIGLGIPVTLLQGAGNFANKVNNFLTRFGLV